MFRPSLSNHIELPGDGQLWRGSATYDNRKELSFKLLTSSMVKIPFQGGLSHRLLFLKLAIM